MRRDKKTSDRVKRMLIDVGHADFDDDAGFTQADMNAAFRTGVDVAKDLDKYKRRVDEIVETLRGYNSTDQSRAYFQRRDVLNDYREAARLVGMVDQIGSFFGHDVTKEYAASMVNSLDSIRDCLVSLFGGMHPPASTTSESSDPQV